MSFCPDRLKRLQGVLAESDEDPIAMYVRDTANIEWLTGFEGVFDEERAHALWVPSAFGELALHTDSRYFLACMHAACDTPIVVDEESTSMAKWACSMWVRELDRLGGLGGRSGSSVRAGGGGREPHLGNRQPDAKQAEIGAQDVRPFLIESSMSLLEYRALEKELRGHGHLIETDGLIASLRSVKDPDEISKLKASQAVTDAAFSHICKFIRPGMTERDVRLELDICMMRSGAQSLAFPTIVACGANAASPHAKAGDNVLEAGQCVVMDFGARVCGYCSDMTRTVFLGAPDSKVERAWDAVRSANELVEASLCAGMTGKLAHEMAIGAIDDAGFAGMMGHGLGHGVGLEIHELPTLSPRYDKPLVCGNVVTVEPGIYVPNEFGMRLEDFGVITEHGFELFTQSTHDTVVL